VGDRGKQRAALLWHLYQDGWEILTHWATCVAPEGGCALEAGLWRLGVDPGDLLAALVLSDPSIIGAPRRHP